MYILPPLSDTFCPEEIRSIRFDLWDDTLKMFKVLFHIGPPVYEDAGVPDEDFHVSTDFLQLGQHLKRLVVDVRR
jgi:hypothetical protein